ncbi:MAG TPA: hypothetical protein VLB27_04220 [candidate division Zixibacteria bacterium]|nr:hypothetical protein [candidate division Zixibacteria bacterium]
MRARESSFGTRDVMQLVVFSLIVVVGPLLVYPRTFDVDLTVTWPSLFLAEFAYYLIVSALLNTGSGAGAAALGALVSFGYRICLAALFGLMIFAPGAAELGEAIGEGVYKFWPAFALFILSAPFVTVSLVRTMIERMAAESQAAPQFTAPREPVAVERPVRSEARKSVYTATLVTGSEPREAAPPVEYAFGEAENTGAPASLNGFERGVRYLAEDGSVRVAAVVDPNGLQLASTSRMGFIAEAWSPLAVTMMSENASVFARHGRQRPLQLEALYDDLKIDCRAIGPFLLMVVAERHADDLLGVRISQASDMIAKYISTRYSPAALASMEVNDVRNA